MDAAVIEAGAMADPRPGTAARVARFGPELAPRLVIKIGSALLVDSSGEVRRDWLETVADDAAARIGRGQRIVIVSSGSVALGARRLRLPKGGRASLEDAQASAAVGQILLSSIYAELFAARGLPTAQMLVTLDDLEDRRRYLNAAATLERLLSLGVVPVLNENDSVATAEIRFGDNDRLAARVAQAASASALVLLSDVDGLYTADPHGDPNAQFIECVERLDGHIEAMAARTSASGLGSGGMVSKLQAARIAGSAGVHMAIVSGRQQHPLARFEETGRGTVFVPAAPAPARKAWLAGRLRVAGRLYVDAGAVGALARGASLLAAGVTRVEGTFRRGDPVDIAGPDGGLVARGLVAYDVEDAARIAGTRQDAQESLLGYVPRGAMIHRDQLVML
jgi:glutamate 5-kinase